LSRTRHRIAIFEIVRRQAGGLGLGDFSCTVIGVPVLISETGETSKLQPTHTTPEQPPAFTNRFAPPARRIELTELIYLAGIPPVSAWKRRLAIRGDRYSFSSFVATIEVPETALGTH